MDQTTTGSGTTIIQLAGNVAAQATATALAAAATNAAKPGSQSTEWKAIVGGVLLTTLVAVLKAASVIPGPWMLPAVALSTGLSVGAYAIARGNVKAAALSAAAAALSSVTPPVSPDTRLTK